MIKIKCGQMLSVKILIYNVSSISVCVVCVREGDETCGELVKGRGKRFLVSFCFCTTRASLVSHLKEMHNLFLFF